MFKGIQLAKPVDMSVGFKDFFATIGMTGTGLVTKAIAAVIAMIALRLAMQTAGGDAKTALRKGTVALGTLMVAVLLAVFGDTLFSTLPTKG